MEGRKGGRRKKLKKLTRIRDNAGSKRKLKQNKFKKLL
jgi:hypothetical protein